jgi:DNA-binding transcriptional LysR family regulator
VVALNARWFPLKVLPIDLPGRPWPVVAVTLKHRTLNPMAQRFVDEVRAFVNDAIGDLRPDVGAIISPAARRP